MITIAERVHIPQSPDTVWRVLSDPSRVVSCIDGSELGEHHEDGSFDARIAVRFAAIRVGFGARANLELEEERRTGRLVARGSDSRGSTRVQGHARFEVSPDEEGSVVDLEGQIEVNGPLASLVTTGAVVVVERMTRSFAAQLAATCAELDPDHAPAVAPSPTPGSSHRTTAVWERIASSSRRAWQRLTEAIGHRARKPVDDGGVR